MGLISTEVEVGLNGRTVQWYEDKGYKIPKRVNYGKLSLPSGTKILVKVEDLSFGSGALVNVKCDCEECDMPYLSPMRYVNYLRCVKEDGKYYCQKCASTMFGQAKSIKTLLKKGISFEQWCITNNRQDVLARFDVELNKCNPSDILYATSKKYYFTCPRNLHESELKTISSYTRGQEGSISCNKCGSFGQFLVDEYGDNALDLYWSDKNSLSAWDISYGSSIKIWIKCQNKDYHDDYDIDPRNFVNGGNRCPYCNSNSGKVHPLDSLGKILEDKGLLYLWSDKNEKTAFQCSRGSKKEFLWHCHNNKHKDYLRDIKNSRLCDYRCPECNNSIGEVRISNFLLLKNITYIPQKTYTGLVGKRNGLLSYDFYIPSYNVLIEYQGGQHEAYVEWMHPSIADFEQQQEHDKRKHEYAKVNNINLLEIWYWDYDNIETILEKELSLII